MNKTYPLALHIFRRDLRLRDNSALLAALKNAEQVLPCFIFDSRQLDNNPYYSNACVEFMLGCLADLQQQLQKHNAKLYFFYGIAEEIVERMLTALPIKAVFINRDYTPFSLNRDQQIAHVCKNHNVDFESYDDALLNEPEAITKADGTPYVVFSQFFRKARLLPVSVPQINRHDNYYTLPISFALAKIPSTILKTPNSNLALKGGREEAKKLLKNIIELKNYAELRNFPAKLGTSMLSAHNKFGTISIREFFHAIVKQHGVSHRLISELYWRDFFIQIAWHFPKVFGHAFRDSYESLTWNNDRNLFKRWCEGTTGFPIVDAGMRQLNTSSYMHNRVRMIVGSFLIKDLHIDWRWGEHYFAQQLMDYDPSVNNGNWQWVASTGCDAQPYFRIFNPWLQQKKFDPECEYIKQWVPELRSLSAIAIHQLADTALLHPSKYPKPIVNHSVESKISLAMYRNLRKNNE